MARSLGYLIDKSLQVGRVTWEMECRAQDLEFRRKEKEKFLIQNNRRHGTYSLPSYHTSVSTRIAEEYSDPTPHYLFLTYLVMLAVLARATQLRAVTILSATLSGFSFTVLTNLPIPGALHFTSLHLTK